MLPSTEQRQLIDATRDFVAREIAPHAGTWETTGTGVPTALLERLAALGYFGLLTPRALGGSGLDMTSYARVTEELAAGDCGLTNLVNVSNSPVCAALVEHGTPAQHTNWLAPLAAGRLRGCFMLTEAAAGSDAAAVRTRAVRTSGGWRLDGVKRFVTAGRSAQLALVVAVSDPAAGKRGISAFLVPTDTPGYRVLRVEDKLGHRNCDTCEVALDGVEVGNEHLLGAPGAGLRIALSYLNGGRIGVAAQALGVARAALEHAIAYARERTTFGQPIVRHQAVGFRLARMASRLAAARALTLAAAARVDAGANAAVEASMAKAEASAMAEAVTSAALQVHGGQGYLRDCPVEKLYRDARVLSIYEGTNDIQHLVIARAIDSGWSPRP
ncbi:MAG: acyl-CoA dehydrogenase family protein [Gammaproteobacteria bacterium]